METRYMQMQDVTTRTDENGDLFLEGMFVVYDSIYNVYPGATESIARGALAEAIKGDVRALYNHNSDIVLGRTSAGTLELKDTEDGLWGRIHINAKDTQAVDVYERVKRGDISCCSFGFEIPAGCDVCSKNPDGSLHWTITRVEPLYEVSPSAFPAYEATHINARERQRDAMRERELAAWKERMKGVLKHGA